MSQKFLVCLFTLLLLSETAPGANALKPETVRVWDSYLAAVEGSVKKPATADSQFLLLDKGREQRRALQRGEVLISQMNRKSPLPAWQALIHDWVGALFIPNATIADVMAVTRRYDRYPKVYAPTIVQARLVSKSPDEKDVFSVDYVRRVLFITTTIRTDYDARYVELDPTHWYSTARSLSIQEKDESEKKGDHKLLPKDGDGYVWRIYTLNRYEQRDKGVYFEQESIALSRPIPASMYWIAEPIVRRLSKDLLRKSLLSTKEAVLSQIKK